MYTAAGKSLPLVLWTSRLTENGEVEKYLRKDDYIIQIWTAGVNCPNCKMFKRVVLTMKPQLSESNVSDIKKSRTIKFIIIVRRI